MTLTEKNRIIDKKTPSLAVFFVRLKFRLCGFKVLSNEMDLAESGIIRWVLIKERGA
jgi:hypothetical protein